MTPIFSTMALVQLAFISPELPTIVVGVVIVQAYAAPRTALHIAPRVLLSFVARDLKQVLITAVSVAANDSSVIEHIAAFIQNTG